MTVKKGLGKGLDSLIVSKVEPANVKKEVKSEKKD